MQKIKRKYKNQSNSGLDFISSHLRKSEAENTIGFKDLYALYKVFCENEGYKKPALKKDFKSILENENFKIDNSSKHANQMRIFGVNLKNL